MFRARDVRTKQVQRLAELMRRKGDVEGEIVRHVEELAGAYERVRGEVGAAVEGRMRALEEALVRVRDMGGVGDGGTTGNGDEDGEVGREERQAVEMALDGAGQKGRKRKRGGLEIQDLEEREVVDGMDE